MTALCTVIEESDSLLHLDLSGMDLRDKVTPILHSIKSAKHQTLASVHLHDNSFSFELKDFIMKTMGIETADYHKLHDSQNTADHDIMEQSILQRAFIKQEKIYSKVHKFFKQSDITESSRPIQRELYESRLLNHEINDDTK